MSTGFGNACTPAHSAGGSRSPISSRFEIEEFRVAGRLACGSAEQHEIDRLPDELLSSSSSPSRYVETDVLHGYCLASVRKHQARMAAGTCHILGCVHSHIRFDYMLADPTAASAFGAYLERGGCVPRFSRISLLRFVGA